MSETSIIPNIKKGKLTEQIFQHLRDLIVSGTWATGYRIPSESELAESFGVSRMSVRSALQRLEMLGLIDIKVGYGSVVKDFSLTDYLSQIGDLLLSDSSIQEVIQFRHSYEAGAIKLAIKNAGDEELLHLNDLYDRLAEAFSGTDNKVRVNSVYELCHYICTISGNHLFVRLDAALKNELRSADESFYLAYGGAEEYLSVQKRLINAMISRDTDAALSIFSEMIDASLNKYSEPSK